MLTAEQIVAAQKSNMETLFGLSTKAFEGMEKLIELNMQVAKAAMAEAADSAQAGQRRLGDLDTGERGRHALAQQAVLDHRKPVPFRQRQHELV